MERPWLLRYYYDSGQQDKATAHADRLADVHFVVSLDGREQPVPGMKGVTRVFAGDSERYPETRRRRTDEHFDPAMRAFPSARRSNSGSGGSAWAPPER